MSNELYVEKATKIALHLNKFEKTKFPGAQRRCWCKVISE